MSTNSTEVTPFHWGDIALTETVFIDGAPHATRFAVGEWLEYDDPIRAISKLLERNSYIEEHSVVVKLTTTDGKNYDTKVYHPIGFLLIVMESGQPKAVLKKQEVAEFMWHFTGPKRMSFKERMELLKHGRVLLNNLAKTKDAFERDGLIVQLREVQLALGLPMPDIARLGKSPDQLALPGV